MGVARTLVHFATAQVVLVFGQIGQVAEVGEGANDLHRLVTGQAFEQLLQGFFGFGIGIAPKGHREFADLLDQRKNLVALMVADDIAQDTAQQADVFYQLAFIVTVGSGRHATMVTIPAPGRVTSGLRRSAAQATPR